MEYIHALALLLVLALAASVAVYFYVAHTGETPPQKKPAPQPAAKTEGVKAAGKEPPYPLPPELPRTIGTIKILAQEDPEIVANICKRWLRK